MTTKVTGKTFVFDGFRVINDTIKDFTREIYHIGEWRRRGLVDVWDHYESTHVSFSPADRLSDYSRATIYTIIKRKKSPIEKLDPSKEYWLHPGDVIVIQNEDQGEKVKLRIQRERPASTHDRSRR